MTLVQLAYRMLEMLIYERSAGSGQSWSRQFPSLGGPSSVSAVPVRPSIDILAFLSVFWFCAAGFMSVAWWIWPLYPLPFQCLPPQASGPGVGAVLSWSDFQASGGCRGCWVSGSSLVLFWYPAHSGADSVAGTFRFRFCQVSFLIKKPTWGVCHGEVRGCCSSHSS